MRWVRHGGRIGVDSFVPIGTGSALVEVGHLGLHVPAHIVAEAFDDSIERRQHVRLGPTERAESQPCQRALLVAEVDVSYRQVVEEVLAASTARTSTAGRGQWKSRLQLDRGTPNSDQRLEQLLRRQRAAHHSPMPNARARRAGPRGRVGSISGSLMCSKPSVYLDTLAHRRRGK